MAEDRDALLDHYRQMRADLLSAIDGLSDDEMTEPSLDGWSVRDHLAHIAYWDDLRASEVSRISAGHESAWRMNGEREEALNAIVYELRRSLSVPQVRWELDAAGERVRDAIASATPDGLDPARYGEAGLLSRHEALHTGWIRRWREERGR